MTRNCRHCGLEFSGASAQKYCGGACAKAGRSRLDARRKAATCTRCGRVTQSQQTRQSGLCGRCRYADGRVRVPCPRCGREFWPWSKNDHARKFCCAAPGRGTGRHRRPSKVRREARERAARVETVHRARVLASTGGVCGICWRPIESNYWHVDHIVPLSKGGAHSYANTQPSHPTCNIWKGDRTVVTLRKPALQASFGEYPRAPLIQHSIVDTTGSTTETPQTVRVVK